LSTYDGFVAPKRTSEQAEETRTELIRAGRVLFGQDGFASTKAADVAARAGVTRGALLHHFGDKEGLFAAVLESLEDEVASHVVADAVKGSTPLEWLRFGFSAFLRECTRPDVTQIMLIDGPSVLGWETWHEIDSRYGYRPLLDIIRAAVTAGQIDTDDAESLAHLLLGALAEAATVIGRSDDAEKTRARMVRSLNRLIDGLSAERDGS
jgi:AcrR family transcriptional regulator